MEIQSHKHDLERQVNVWRRSFVGEDGSPRPLHDGTGTPYVKQTTETGGLETRPKNVTVYYYIKIN